MAVVYKIAAETGRIHPDSSTEPMNKSLFATLPLIASASWAFSCPTESAQARCEIYPKGSDKVETMVPRTFGQRQGDITITREDGVTYDLSPMGDAPGNFYDHDGNAAIAKAGSVRRGSSRSHYRQATRFTRCSTPMKARLRPSRIRLLNSRHPAPAP